MKTLLIYVPTWLFRFIPGASLKLSYVALEVDAIEADIAVTKESIERAYAHIAAQNQAKERWAQKAKKYEMYQMQSARRAG